MPRYPPGPRLAPQSPALPDSPRASPPRAILGPPTAKQFVWPYPSFSFCVSFALAAAFRASSSLLSGHRSRSLLRLFPPPRLCRQKYRFNHRHIRNRILQRHRCHAPLPNGSRKRVSLHRILIANRNRLRSNSPAKNVASVINKNPRRPIVRCIKRNFNLDSSFCPQELHSLVRHRLRAASEHRLPRRKLQNRRRQSVRLEIWISVE